MEKKEFAKYIKALLKEKGFTYIPTNKYAIEYPECYVTLWFRYGDGKVAINYNISFKAVHGIMNIKEDFKKWNNCDFNIWGILNDWYDTNKKYRENLLELDFLTIRKYLYEMLELYIEPFNNDLKNLIDFINRGRIYRVSSSSENTYVDPYRFLPEADEFLLKNGMRPTEEFFE